jgi:hypothetical protein
VPPSPGLTNPAIQFPAYADYALDNKLISKPVSGRERCRAGGVGVRGLGRCAERHDSEQAVPAVPAVPSSLPQLHDSIQFWMPLCRWAADFCDSHNWRFACIIGLQVRPWTPTWAPPGPRIHSTGTT